MNPDFQPAELVSSRWTMAPRIQWTAGESNPDYLGANQASSHWTSSPGGNDEARMTNDEVRVWTWITLFVIRHSSFVIPKVILGGLEPPIVSL